MSKQIDNLTTGCPPYLGQNGYFIFGNSLTSCRKSRTMPQNIRYSAAIGQHMLCLTELFVVVDFLIKAGG